MNGPSESEQQRALEPVRERLIRRARGDAEQERAAARQESAEQTAAAQIEAQRILDEARAHGRTQAATETAAARSTARRRARALELAAEREIYEAVRQGVERGIESLRESPRYPALRDALERRARELLGPEAEVVEDPRGGVVATAPGRRVDLSLPAIAARLLDGLGEEVARLWTP